MMSFSFKCPTTLDPYRFILFRKLKVWYCTTQLTEFYFQYIEYQMIKLCPFIVCQSMIILWIKIQFLCRGMMASAPYKPIWWFPIFTSAACEHFHLLAYFTPPSVNPLIKYRWQNMNTRKRGMNIITPPANDNPIGLRPPLISLARNASCITPTINVCRGVSGIMRRVQM